jgi:cytochrome d ubiquinol oxidase subunit II
MQTIWFMLVAFMLVAYVIFDGFDIGAGIITPLLARSDDDKRLILRTIGPVWDGNEVWLLAAGGTLYFAFPLLYASAFSGFYLPLNMVLWLLILRALGIEFRMRLDEPVWKGFFDGAFVIASALLAIFFGAALGNVIRGVPLGADGFFFEPLWTNWRVGQQNGILDWYTVLAGVVALFALMLHGCLYVAMKTSGDLSARARRLVDHVWPVILALTVISLPATAFAVPGILTNYSKWPIGYVIPLVVIASLVCIFLFHRQGRERQAFLSSCVYLAAMLSGAAFALYPNVLPSSLDAQYNMTIYNAASGRYSLSWGLVWWTFGMLIAIGYFVFIYRMFRGKVTLLEGEGYH